MIIELVGLPASGKSILARRLVDEVHGHVSTKRPLQIFDGVVGVVRFPLLTILLLVRAVCSGRLRDIDTWYRVKYFVLTRIAELGRAWRSKGNTVQVLDEGPLQALLSVGDTITARSVKCMLHRTPATLIVLFLVDEEVRRKRLRERSYKLRPHLTDAERTVWEEHVIAQFKEIAECVEKDTRTHIVRTEHDIEQLVAFIKKV